jgi:hypothetical protein
LFVCWFVGVGLVSMRFASCFNVTSPLHPMLTCLARRLRQRRPHCREEGARHSRLHSAARSTLQAAQLERRAELHVRRRRHVCRVEASELREE